MLTGRYPASHHVYRNGNAFFPPNEVLVTRILADHGYDCGLVGKLHLSAAKYHEKRTDDGYRVFHWNHHPTPDAARGDAYEHWLRHEKKVDPQALYRDKGAFVGAGVPAEYHQSTWCAEMATFCGSHSQVKSNSCTWSPTVRVTGKAIPVGAPSKNSLRVNSPFSPTTVSATPYAEKAVTAAPGVPVP